MLAGKSQVQKRDAFLIPPSAIAISSGVYPSGISLITDTSTDVFLKPNIQETRTKEVFTSGENIPASVYFWKRFNAE